MHARMAYHRLSRLTRVCVQKDASDNHLHALGILRMHLSEAEFNHRAGNTKTPLASAQGRAGRGNPFADKAVVVLKGLGAV